jgi:ornithine decarboxylase
MSGRNSALADRRGRGIARALLPGVIGLAAFTEELADEGNPMLGTLTPGPVAGSLDPFLARHPAATTPFLVVDLDVVRRQYCSLTAALPGASVFYAVKANPAPEVLSLLINLGSSFDVASRGEIELCLGLGADPARLSYGNTVKKERDIAAAYRLGVRLFTVDSRPELDKVLRTVHNGTVFVRCRGSSAARSVRRSRCSCRRRARVCRPAFHFMSDLSSATRAPGTSRLARSRNWRGGWRPTVTNSPE